MNLDSTRDALFVYDTMLVKQDREQVESLISGMQIGMLWANAELRHRKQPLLYCQPEKLRITAPQMVDMLRKTIRENPRLGDYPIGLAVLTTLQDTFPCKDTN